MKPANAQQGVLNLGFEPTEDFLRNSLDPSRLMMAIDVRNDCYGGRTEQ